MYRSITALALFIALALTATTVSAQGKIGADELVRASGPGKNLVSINASAPGLPANELGGNAVVITQNASQAIENNSGVACPTAPNSVYRRIPLSGFGLGANGIDISSVDIGIEAVQTPQTGTLNLYTLNGAFTVANLTLVASAPVTLSAADDLSIKNVPITATVDDQAVLVVELAFSNGVFFGGNTAGQTAPTYLRAAGCGVLEPTDASTLGAFPAGWVVNVRGTTDPIVGASLSVSPSSIDFGDVAPGSSSTPQTVTLTNNGTSAVTIASITGSGAPFTVTQTGTDLTLDPGQTTTFTVTYSPTAAGNNTGTITITSNAAGSPQTITLTGTSTAVTAIPPGDTTGDPTFIRAGFNVAACAASTATVSYETRAFTVTNAGAYTITTDYSGTSGYDGAIHLYQGSFDPANPCANLVGADDDFNGLLGSQIVDVALTAGNYVLVVSGFGADDFGTYTGTVEGPGTVTFGAAGPALTVTPTAVTLNAAVGGTDTDTVTITNTGGTTINLASVTYSGNGAITASAVPAGALAPGASRTVTLTFTPTAVGTVSGTLTVTSDAPGSPVTVAITGVGTAPSTGTTYSSTDTPIAIPDEDPTGITSTIVVPAGAPTIADLDVDLNLTHTWTGDLTITLTRGATSVVIMDRPGYTGTGFGCSGDNPNIIADDEGTNGAIETSCVAAANPGYPVADGRYTPNNPLSAFDNTSATGTWTLTVSDAALGDTGSLDSWALIVSANTAGENGAGDLASRLSVAPNPMAGAGQVNLTVASTQDVRVALYDALGREVRVLFERSVAAGQEALIGFTTDGLPAGVYVVRASGSNLSLTQRVTVVR